MKYINVFGFLNLVSAFSLHTNNINAQKYCLMQKIILQELVQAIRQLSI